MMNSDKHDWNMEAPGNHKKHDKTTRLRITMRNVSGFNCRESKQDYIRFHSEPHPVFPRCGSHATQTNAGNYD